MYRAVSKETEWAGTGETHQEPSALISFVAVSKSNTFLVTQWVYVETRLKHRTSGKSDSILEDKISMLFLKIKVNLMLPIMESKDYFWVPTTVIPAHNKNKCIHFFFFNQNLSIFYVSRMVEWNDWLNHQFG